ncbi:PTS sugar transporter subunit IIA [Salibacterium aidingense]|uniref:PTS sugar transporter subunit IIA n=1 Tax=Salibacterium aidingense TaxID=384933 RepID=UPI003BDFC099
MRLSNLLKPENIIFHSLAATQEEVFREIAGQAEQEGITKKPKRIVKGLKEREKQSTTGFQDAIAIPHTKSKEVKQPAIIIVTTKQGVEWNSMDSRPATFFIALLIPEKEEGDTHLKILSSLSRMLMEEKNRTQLLKAPDEKALHAFLTEKVDLQKEGL